MAASPGVGLPQLIVSKLTVDDLKACLLKCGLPRTGLKAVLQARLLQALKEPGYPGESVARAVRDVFETAHGPPRPTPPSQHSVAARAPQPGTSARPSGVQPRTTQVRCLVGHQETQGRPRVHTRRAHPRARARASLNRARHATQPSAPVATAQVTTQAVQEAVVRTIALADPFSTAVRAAPSPRSPGHTLQRLWRLTRARARVRGCAQAEGPWCLAPARLLLVANVQPVGWVGPPPTLTQLERTVRLSAQDVRQLREAGSELQFLCVRLQDPVAGRLHWPCHASLQVNACALTVPCRAAINDLGRTGRDAPATLPPSALAPLLSSPVPLLKITLAGYDARSFAFAARVARRSPAAALAAAVPSAQPLSAALQRTVRLLADDGGGVAATSLVLSLRDPLGGARITTPVRYEACQGLAVFDLHSFLSMAARSRCWTCPLCNAGGPPESLRVDSYVAAVLAGLALTGETEVIEILVDPSAAWRARLPGGRLGRLVTPEEMQRIAEKDGITPSPFTRPDDGVDQEPGVKRARVDDGLPHDVIDLCDDSGDDGDDAAAAAAACPAPAPAPQAVAHSPPWQPRPGAQQPAAAAGLRVALRAPAAPTLLPRQPPGFLFQPGAAENPTPPLASTSGRATAFSSQEAESAPTEGDADVATQLLHFLAQGTDAAPPGSPDSVLILD